MTGSGSRDCFAALIAMDGMYAENAGAFFCRNDKLKKAPLGSDHVFRRLSSQFRLKAPKNVL
jgi:hypothetical protein